MSCLLSLYQLQSYFQYHSQPKRFMKPVFHSLADLEKSGNSCLANKDTGEKCYATRVPNSLYCKEHITNRPYGLPE